ncbi:hypothetical protein AMTRI_Chr05g60560 [Amborella trichopoda]
MSTTNVRNLVDKCEHIYFESSQNGPSLALLFSLSSNSPYILSLVDALNVLQEANRVVKLVDKYGQLSEILLPYLWCVQSFRNNHFVDAYNAFEMSVNAFLHEFKKWKSAWAMKAMLIVAYEMQKLAEMSKCVGALYVTCKLLKVYFKLGTVHLWSITYMNYTNHFEVFVENFLYLVPVKLSLGFGPKNQLLERYNLFYPTHMGGGGLIRSLLIKLMIFVKKKKALQRGHLRLLQHALQEYEDQFLRSGLYLLLEKLELQDPNEAHQVKLEAIVKAFRRLEIDMDVDENRMKCDFAHKSKVVILSKQDHFPMINGRLMN